MELKKYSCPKCYKDFNKKGDYTRHINRKNGCETNKIEELNNLILKLKEENEKLNLKEENKILKLKEENEKLKLKLKEEKNENDKLKEENKNLKNQVILYNNTINNIYNTNHNYIFNINNFNDIKDYNGAFQNFIKFIGKSIYLNTVKNIYLNSEKPENHCVYVSDKSRGIVKIYNNGIWQTKNMIIIDDIINNIVKQFNLSIEEIKSDEEKYKKLKNTILNKANYIQMCDLDYLDGLEDDEEENKDRIQRCKDFRKLVYDEIITLLHDNKKIVIESYKKNFTRSKLKNILDQSSNNNHTNEL